MTTLQKTLHVKGMSCGNCARHVEKAVGELDGVETVAVTLDQEQVTVVYRDDATTLGAISKAIEDADYEVAGEVEA
ncbi:heavy-metal-associated domain-containing protein [Lujinxingia vulgaris]|uniref:Heavy-metal-associated domain-containing protein n=1 Tax=Lujinxingia vulgaris TaxID=2600176 RepID=A0A5C6X3Z8_9DELT|nr:copper ion binding protein [Lujinxingia vulgaris]TXD33808.1 heavy-metal-associated domain-containing protein [Lujinxingia vulgaris]